MRGIYTTKYSKHASINEEGLENLKFICLFRPSYEIDRLLKDNNLMLEQWETNEITKDERVSNKVKEILNNYTVKEVVCHEDEEDDWSYRNDNMYGLWGVLI